MGIKLRCRCCGHRIGLGIKSRRVWEPGVYAHTTYRFCSLKCQELFLEARQASIDRQRTISAPIHGPPAS